MREKLQDQFCGHFLNLSQGIWLILHQSNFWQKTCRIRGYWQCSMRPEPGTMQNSHLQSYLNEKSIYLSIYLSIYIYSYLYLYKCMCMFCQNSTSEFIEISWVKMPPKVGLSQIKYSVIQQLFLSRSFCHGSTQVELRVWSKRHVHNSTRRMFASTFGSLLHSNVVITDCCRASFPGKVVLSGSHWFSVLRKARPCLYCFSPRCRKCTAGILITEIRVMVPGNGYAML